MTLGDLLMRRGPNWQVNAISQIVTYNAPQSVGLNTFVKTGANESHHVACDSRCRQRAGSFLDFNRVVADLRSAYQAWKLQHTEVK